MKIITLKNSAESKFKEKESLFIGKAFRVDSENDAEKILSEIRKKYYDATHHCFAYKINPDFEKYSDDGEPSGTAGIRLLNSINHFNLTNVLVVSIRYFGGKKLGVGPLGKAYYRSGLETLENADKIELKEFIKASIIFDFSQTKNAHHFLQKYNAIIKENTFEKKPKITFLMEQELFGNFSNEITTASNRTVLLKKEDETFFI